MIESAAGPDPVTPAIARHMTDSGRVFLELPDGRLTVGVHTAKLGDSRDGLVNSGDRGLGGNHLSRVRFRPVSRHGAGRTTCCTVSVSSRRSWPLSERLSGYLQPRRRQPLSSRNQPLPDTSARG